MMSQEFFANVFIWISNLIFFFSLIPQIFLNKKLCSTFGLSDLFLLGYMNSVIANLGYTFCTDLPLVYKIMNPLYAFAVFTLIFQRFKYFCVQRDRKTLILFCVNLVLILIVSILIFFKKISVTWFLGWIPILISLWKKIPQIFKIQRTKSVYGFSLGFILLSLFACFFEILGVIFLKLPVQVLFQDLKGISVYMIFLVQFILYRKNSQLEGITENA